MRFAMPTACIPNMLLALEEQIVAVLPTSMGLAANVYAPSSTLCAFPAPERHV
jgi:hypothetical protein